MEKGGLSHLLSLISSKIISLKAILGHFRETGTQRQTRQTEKKEWPRN